MEDLSNGITYVPWYTLLRTKKYMFAIGNDKRLEGVIKGLFYDHDHIQ